MYVFFQHGLSELDECNVKNFGAIPREFAHPGFTLGGCAGEPSTWITPFTSMFMHGGLLHIGGNMLFLWIFGNNVEDSMGRVRFLIFYVLGGLAALAAQTLVDTNSTAPTIGASGAVAAVLGGYIVLFPKARVVTVIFLVFFFTIVEIKALFVLGAWFLLQVLNGYSESANPVGDQGGGVAYFAHIGGFVFGMLLIHAFATREKEELVH
jgi:membrane associated rhomboid family serine protease